MELQLATALAWPPPDGEGPPHHGALARALAAEDQGFEGVWLMDGGGDAESGVGPSLHLAAAWLAARTESLAIGLHVALPPSVHPLRLAEELATLDGLSRGRLAWSVAPIRDGLDVAREQLEIVEQAWTGDRFSYAGAFFDVPELRCLPGPAQQPGPPVRIAPREPSDRATLDWAAGSGRPLWLDADGPLDELRGRLAAWAEGAERAGHDPGALAPRVVRRLRVADDAATRACRDDLLAIGEALGVDTVVCWLDAGPDDAEGVAAAQERVARHVLPDLA